MLELAVSKRQKTVIEEDSGFGIVLLVSEAGFAQNRGIIVQIYNGLFD